MSIVALLASMAAAFAVPEAAKSQSAPENAGAAEKPQAQSKDAKICRRIETTGSRTGGQKVCLTREEWRRVDR